MFRKRLRGPTPEFNDHELATIYEHLVDLHTRVGRLEGRGTLLVALVLAILGAIISVAVKVW